jgi:hypothetical protein
LARCPARRQAVWRSNGNLVICLRRVTWDVNPDSRQERSAGAGLPALCWDAVTLPARCGQASIGYHHSHLSTNPA